MEIKITRKETERTVRCHVLDASDVSKYLVRPQVEKHFTAIHPGKWWSCGGFFSGSRDEGDEGHSRTRRGMRVWEAAKRTLGMHQLRIASAKVCRNSSPQTLRKRCRGQAGCD